jgi:hypothetical protein
MSENTEKLELKITELENKLKALTAPSGVDQEEYKTFLKVAGKLPFPGYTSQAFTSMMPPYLRAMSSLAATYQPPWVWQSYECNLTTPYLQADNAALAQSIQNLGTKVQELNAKIDTIDAKKK